MHYLEIHTLDVGQGDCSFLVIKEYSRIEKIIMIDGGPKGSMLRIFCYWFSNFMTQKIDTVIISHWDADHFQGVYQMDDSFKRSMFADNCKIYSPNIGRIENFLTEVNAEFMDDLQLGGTLFDVVSAGSPKYQLIMVCHGTEHQITPCNDINDHLLATATNLSSLVFIIKAFIDDDYLFSYYTGGDIPCNVEELIFDSPYKLSSFKMSHHGSASFYFGCISQ